MNSKGRRLSTRLAVALIAGLSIGMQLAGQAAAGSVRAHAARQLSASDTAHLHFVHSSGAWLYEEGIASGTMPGRMHANVNVGATINGNFTIYIRGGTIRGHGSAIPHGSGVYESFSGSLVATGGSGRYSHARGRAQLYGTFNRNNYSLLIQTAGTLRY